MDELDDLMLSEKASNMGFPGGSDDKESACNAGDLGLIPRSGRPLEKHMVTYSRIPAWRIPWTEELGGVHGVAKTQTRLSN